MYINLEDILFLIGKGDFSAAKKQVDTLLEKDNVVKSDHLYSLVKCITFWAYRIKKYPLSNKQEFLHLLSQWKIFQTFCLEDGISLQENVVLFIKGIFGHCQDFFLTKRKDIPQEYWHDMSQILISWDELFSAKTFLLDQIRDTPKDVRVLQKLSLVYYKLDNGPLAKLYLSYAFLFDPLRVDLALIDIPDVIRIKLTLMQSGFRQEELLLWIPIYASIRGVFPPKKLSNLEIQFILRSLKKIESLYTQKNLSTMQPVLLYHYLFALHHFYLTQNDVCVNKVLRRINYSNEKIYQDILNITLKKKLIPHLVNLG